jgi:hypothetical protein
MNRQAIVIKHIMSLCCLHNIVLQNTFNAPTTGESFMFRNYVKLLGTYNFYEKFWLVTLLPDIF